MKKTMPKNSANEATLHLTPDALRQIFQTIGKKPAESGGALGGNESDNLVSHYHFDDTSKTSPVTYSPDTKILNKLFKSEWNPKGLRLKGFVHSHPRGNNRPSYGDEVYAEQILNAIEDLDYLWLPIVNTIPDTGEFRLTPWVAYPQKKGVKIVRANISIIDAENSLFELPDEGSVATIPCNEVLNEIVIQSQEAAEEPELQVTTNESQDAEPDDMTFDRVKEAYDLNLMKATRIIAVGAGGAAEWLENLARAGVGQFVLIDPDTVSETNLATQQVYRKDIGRNKVDCIAERIMDINPNAYVAVYPQYLDELSDEDLEKLINDDLAGHASGKSIICGLTDNFWAQARVNRIALNFGIPSLCAQVYEAGRAAEITFTEPSVTQACHRCLLSSRYKYYLNDKKENTVTSHGTPIFTTNRLNALKGFITLALIHHGSGHPRWGKLLSQIGSRNLLQIRLDPELNVNLGLAVFNKVFDGADKKRLLFDETVWLPQQPENEENGYPTCPDCKGTGDLHDAIGLFSSTILDKEDETNNTLEKEVS